MRRARGMTLVEVVVAVAILGMISLLLYGAFDALSRGKKGEAMRAERARQGREAIARVQREMSSAYLSLHVPLSQALLSNRTAFVAEYSSFSRVDFTAFAHRRLARDTPESDQAEIGYYVVRDPERDDKYDLVRREQTPVDYEPREGGISSVLAEDVEKFEIEYLDPITTAWTQQWNTSQVSGQPNRLPFEVHVKLTLKGAGNLPPLEFETKFMMQLTQPLSFALPR
jgi:general secretion pathway protein J